MVLSGRIAWERTVTVLLAAMLLMTGLVCMRWLTVDAQSGFDVAVSHLRQS